MSFKQEKVIVIISEFVNDKREFYPITNVPVEKARFFYKDDDGLFKVMASSDYAVRMELNETRLYITNVEIKEKSTKFQVGYEINFTSSEYETSLPVLSVLVEMYNNLIEDSRTIFNYVKKQCFISDDKTTSLVLPNLPSYTVWCMGENGEMFALPVSELYGKFQKLVDTLYVEIKKFLTTDYNNYSKDLRDKTDLLLKELTNLNLKLEASIKNLTIKKNEEIITTGNEKKQEIIDETNNQLNILAGVGLALKPKQVSDIEFLKRVNAKLNEVYEVLGYYKFNDGATHKRVISDSDDGSGVLLNNGLWANIVHNGEVNVSWFGAKGDKKNDDSIPIKKALMFAEKVNIGNGDFIINDLVIEKAWKCKEICGVDKDKTKLYGRITNNISRLNIKNIGVFGNMTGSGFKLLTATNIDNCQAYNHNIGLDISSDGHIVTSRITSCIFAYNKEAGVKIKANGYGQKNCIYLKDIYIVKNGTDADNLTSPATTTDGHGLWIDGGYSITAVNITAEYNSGIGIYITADSYPLIGLTMLCPYMERNKYANMYIKYRYSKTRIEGLNILGEFISDAGHEPVENSIKERGVYMDEKTSPLIRGNSFILGKYTPFDVQRKRTKYLSYEGTPFFNIKDSSNYVDKNKKEVDGETVFFLNDEITGFKDAGDYIYLDTLYKYRLEFKAKSLNIPQRCGVYLQKAESGLNNIYLLASVTPNKWTKHSAEFNAIYDETVFYMRLLNPDRNNDEVYIKDIRITKVAPIEVTPAVALSTANTYQVEKMKQENVYDDYIAYMDEKTAYDKQQKQLNKDKQLAYQETLKENPNLTYEEFLAAQPATLSLQQEPQPSQALKQFMEKYL